MVVLKKHTRFSKTDENQHWNTLAEIFRLLCAVYFDSRRWQADKLREIIRY